MGESSRSRAARPTSAPATRTLRTTCTSSICLTGSIDLVTVTLTGGASGFSNQFLSPTFSSDGTKLAFLSSAPDIVSPSTTGTHAYVRDLVTDTTILASAGTDGVGLPPGEAGAVVIDPTGTLVAVQHRATGQPTNRQIYVRDLSAQTTTLVSRSGQSPGNGTSLGPTFSPDGASLAFVSRGVEPVPRGHERVQRRVRLRPRRRGPRPASPTTPPARRVTARRRPRGSPPTARSWRSSAEAPTWSPDSRPCRPTST